MPDFQFKNPASFVEGLFKSGEESIVAHCTGGSGRTGFMLASYVLRLLKNWEPRVFLELGVKVQEDLTVHTEDEDVIIILIETKCYLQ